jgi:hypothetical protein
LILGTCRDPAKYKANGLIPLSPFFVCAHCKRLPHPQV